MGVLEKRAKFDNQNNNNSDSESTRPKKMVKFEEKNTSVVKHPKAKFLRVSNKKKQSLNKN
jgi:hypothetical protein